MKRYLLTALMVGSLLLMLEGEVLAQRDCSTVRCNPRDFWCANGGGGNRDRVRCCCGGGSRICEILGDSRLNKSSPVPQYYQQFPGKGRYLPASGGLPASFYRFLRAEPNLLSQ